MIVPPGLTMSGALAKVLDMGKDVTRKVTNRAKAEGHRAVVRRAKAKTGTRREAAARRKAPTRRRRKA
jgi:hypothetical protein